MINRVLQSWEKPSATCILEKESILNGGGIKGGGFSKFCSSKSWACEVVYIKA